MKKLVLVFIAAALLLACSCSVSVGYIYPDADRYSVGDAAISEKVDTVKIDWQAGKAVIKYHDKNTVEISEISSSELSERQKLHWLFEDGVLDVRFAASGESIVNAKKELTVLLPQGSVLEKLSISAASAEIDADISAKNARLDTASGKIGVKLAGADECRLETASGKISAVLTDVVKAGVETASGDAEISAPSGIGKFEAKTASGKVKFSAASAKSIEVETASGDVSIAAASVGSIDVETSSGEITADFSESIGSGSFDTASGDIELYVPKDFEFSAEIDTASGKFECDVPTVRKGDTYVSGSGHCELEFETASGDIGIRISGGKY